MQHLKKTQNQDVNTEIESPLASDTDYEACLASFKASIAATEDGRNVPLMKKSFRQHLPSGPLAWQYYVAVLQHTIQLGCTPTPVLQCLLEKEGHLLRATGLSESVDGWVSFLDCLESLQNANHAHTSSLVRRIYGMLAQLATEGERSTKKTHDAVLLRLIKIVGDSAFTRKSKEAASAARLPYALAAKLRRSTENTVLLSHLSQSAGLKQTIITTVYSVAAAPDRFVTAARALFYMPHQRLLAQVHAITLHFANHIRGRRNLADSQRSQRMKVWLQLLQQVGSKTSTDKTLLEAALAPLAGELQNYNAPAVMRPETLVEALLLHQNLDIQLPTTTNKPRRFPALLADVLVQIQAQPKAYTNLLDVALPLIVRHAGIGVLMRCIRTMEEQRLPLSTTINFEVLLAKELNGLRARTDNFSESQLQERAFTLQACEKLINVLSRMGHALPAAMAEVADLVGTRQFDNLLSSARVNNALPVAFCDATKDLSLTERVAVVHQLAYYYSHDTTRTHREVWRSVYYLYNYLVSNSLPIGPLFTKAVVHSSIIRPLAENRFVSARRLIWVCHLVARVEGDEVAARVENHFYTWRGDLIGRAKRIYVGVGGSVQNKAHVGTMKRLGLI